MFNVGGGEILVILLIALVVLGPDKLPDFSRKVGQVVRQVRRFAGGFQDEMRRAMEPEPVSQEPAGPQPTGGEPEAREGSQEATEAGATPSDPAPARASDAEEVPEESAEELSSNSEPGKPSAA